MSTSRLGRTPITSQGELGHVALKLFLEHGFENVTVDDIAKAAGISRRTFFRYFPSKNDLPWGNFDVLLEKMRANLASMPEDIPVVLALRRAIVQFNTYPASEQKYHRERMWLLMNVPSLLSYSTLRYESWRRVLREFIAERLGAGPDDIVPRSIAWICQGVSLASYEQWLQDEKADLVNLFENVFEIYLNTFEELIEAEKEKLATEMASAE